MATGPRGSARQDTDQMSAHFDAELAFLLVVVCLLTAIFAFRN